MGGLRAEHRVGNPRFFPLITNKDHHWMGGVQKLIKTMSVKREVCSTHAHTHIYIGMCLHVTDIVLITYHYYSLAASDFVVETYALCRVQSAAHCAALRRILYAHACFLLRGHCAHVGRTRPGHALVGCIVCTVATTVPPE
jgi:hypothetical protein